MGSLSAWQAPFHLLFCASPAQSTAQTALQSQPAYQTGKPCLPRSRNNNFLISSSLSHVASQSPITPAVVKNIHYTYIYIYIYLKEHVCPMAFFFFGLVLKELFIYGSFLLLFPIIFRLAANQREQRTCNTTFPYPLEIETPECGGRKCIHWSSDWIGKTVGVGCEVAGGTQSRKKKGAAKCHIALLPSLAPEWGSNLEKRNFI